MVAGIVEELVVVVGGGSRGSSSSRRSNTSNSRTLSIYFSLSLPLFFHPSFFPSLFLTYYFPSAPSPPLSRSFHVCECVCMCVCKYVHVSE